MAGHCLRNGRIVWQCHGIAEADFILKNSPALVLSICLLVVNLLTAWFWWRDKRAARLRLQRVSERQLLLLALAGGWPAALFMAQSLRHKTRKQPFGVLLAGCALLNCSALVGLWWFY